MREIDGSYGEGDSRRLGRGVERNSRRTARVFSRTALARSLSSYAATAIWLLEQFLPIRFHIAREGCLVRIDAEAGTVQE